MQALLEFVQVYKSYFDAAQALSAIVNLVGWTLGFSLLYLAWRRNRITSVSVGPLNFQLQAAVEATVSAARAWKEESPGQTVDVPHIRETVAQAFAPDVADQLIGKAVLWVDDNPSNNRLGVRALKKLQLDVDQVDSTERALEAMKGRHYDLVISDMGRGEDLRAGYKLLAAIRGLGNQVPFLIFAGSNRPEFKREAARLGAQLSTNDLIELIDVVIKFLGSDGQANPTSSRSA